MKIWKIRNTHKLNEPVKVGVITSSTTSRGIILNPGQFCLSKPQTTASIDAQSRRGFITVDKEFDNSELYIELGVALDESILTNIAKQTEIKKAEGETTVEEISNEDSAPISKMDEAEKNATEYIEKK